MGGIQPFDGGGAVDPAGVRFQEFTPVKGTGGGLGGNRACPVVHQVKQQGQRRGKAAIFRQVRFQGFRLAASQFLGLKLCPPFIEQVLGFRAESQEGDTILFIGLSAKGAGVKTVQALEYGIGGLLGFLVGPAVHVAPRLGIIRPDQQLKTL